MPHQFAQQPYDGGYDLRDFFDDVVADTSLNQVSFVVAWVKRSGVDALRKPIETLLARGVDLQAIVGISQGGTSRQGLSEILDLASTAYVFHVPGRTFHPKIYLASGGDRALSLVGSHNFTAGGARNNFEAGTVSRLDLTLPADRHYHDSIRSYMEQLIADLNVCKPLNVDLLNAMLTGERYWLSDEDTPAIPAEAEPMEEPSSPQAPAVDPDDAAEAIFTTSANKLRTASYTSSKPKVAGTAPTPTPTAAPGTTAAVGPAAAPPAATATGSHVLRRWYKKLGKIDAQQGTSADWHPSNTMTLVNFRHPIQAQTYFRTEFFAGQTWSNTLTAGKDPKPREVTTIECEVIARGMNLGQFEFEIRHTPEYEAGQGNRATELVWGPLSGYLRATSHYQDYATIERLSDGTYRLHLAATPAGDFIP